MAMKERILITGGAGMIGSHLAEACLTAGFDVTIYDNFCSGRREFVPASCIVEDQDIRSYMPLVWAVERASPTYVLHLAAEPYIPKSFERPDLFWEVNANGTLNLLTACRAFSGIKKIVVVSSSEVYGTARSRSPMREDHPLNPQSTYAVSKLAADRLTITQHHEHGVPAVVFRPFNCYSGRFTQPYVISDIIAQVIRGDESIKLGRVDSVRDFTYAADTAAAILRCALHGKSGETYHYGSGDTHVVGEIVKDVCEVAGMHRPPIEVDTNRLRPNDVLYLQANNSHFEADCGRVENPTPWREGLRLTIEHFKSIGMRWPWESRS